MKHLKTYNEKFTISNLEDLKEICYELTDSGYFIVEFDRLYRERPKYGINYVPKDKEYTSVNYVWIHPSKRMAKIDDVKETLLRLKDYLGEDFRYICVSLCKEFRKRGKEGKSDLRYINLTEDTIIKQQLRSVYLFYNEQ